MEQEISDLTHTCIDKFEADGSAELLSQFATPIPVTVIVRLLGVPESAVDKLLAWSHAMVKVYTLTQSYQDELDANEASIEFIQFLKDQIKKHKNHADDKLLSHLISLQSETDGPTDAEIISIVVLLLNAGHEATVHQLGNAILNLIKHPPSNTQWWNDRNTADSICLLYTSPSPRDRG